jgi:hypothetical protein
MNTSLTLKRDIGPDAAAATGLLNHSRQAIYDLFDALRLPLGS